MAEGPSRIGEARRRAADAKQTAVAVAAAGFIALLLLARASHPGHSASATNVSVPATGTEEQDDDGFTVSPGTLGQGSGSSGGAQTGVS